MIKKLVADEGPAPLSDQAMADALKSRGIAVARRTVAKYREAMNIPPSSERGRPG
jgi:RNA polymerase sigma-54 factor